MPLRQDPPADRSDASLPAEGEISSAARLLDEIRERMERLEGNLSLRERRLARVEKALREADGKLQTERAKFTTERDSLEKGLAQRLREREQQLEESTRSLQEHQQRLVAQLARERETLARIERLTRERDQAAAGLASARQEVLAQRRREQELQTQLAELDQRRIQSTPKSTAEEPAPPPVKPVSIPATNAEMPVWMRSMAERVQPLHDRWLQLNHQRRRAIAAGMIAVPLLAVVIAVSVFAVYPDSYSVSAAVLGEPRDNRALASFATSGGLPGLQLSVQEAEGVLRITQTTRDAAAGAIAVDAAARTAIASLSTPTTRPAGFTDRQKRRETLASRIAALQTRPVTASTQPATMPAFARVRPEDLTTDPAQLLKELQATLTSREALSTRLAEINRRLAAKPPESVTLPAEQLKVAMARDQMLQADSEVLAGRESELADTLRKLIDGARVRFEDLPRRAAEADNAIAEMLKGLQDKDVAESLQSIRTSLSEWSDAAKAMATSWQEQRPLLDKTGPDADPGARQAALENVSKKFQEVSGNSLSAINKTLEAISQGGDGGTKRQVLRRDLTEKLQPAMASRDALAGVAGKAQAAENVDLAASLGKVTGLRAQVIDRRNRLEASVRQQVLSEAQAAFEHENTQLRQEREQVMNTTAGLDEALVQQAAKAFWLLGDSGNGQTAVLARLNIERQRAEALAELRSLDDADAREAAALPPPMVLRRSPATATRITSLSRRLGSAVLGGLIPLLMTGLIAAGVGIRRYWKQSGESIEDYAKALRDLPERRPELEHQEQRG